MCDSEDFTEKGKAGSFMGKFMLGFSHMLAKFSCETDTKNQAVKISPASLTMKAKSKGVA